MTDGLWPRLLHIYISNLEYVVGIVPLENYCCCFTTGITVLSEWLENSKGDGTGRSVRNWSYYYLVRSYIMLIKVNYFEFAFLPNYSSTLLATVLGYIG